MAVQSRRQVSGWGVGRCRVHPNCYLRFCNKRHPSAAVGRGQVIYLSFSSISQRRAALCKTAVPSVSLHSSMCKHTFPFGPPAAFDRADLQYLGDFNNALRYQVG